MSVESSVIPVSASPELERTTRGLSSSGSHEYRVPSDVSKLFLFPPLASSACFYTVGSKLVREKVREFPARFEHIPRQSRASRATITLVFAFKWKIITFTIRLINHFVRHLERFLSIFKFLRNAAFNISLLLAYRIKGLL